MRAFDLKQEALLRWTLDRSRGNCEELFVVKRANETYSDAKCRFSVRNVPMNAQSPLEWSPLRLGGFPACWEPKRSGYLSCTFVSVPYSAKCIGEWTGISDCAD